jgi:sugar lactone lactonase YvrE
MMTYRIFLTTLIFGTLLFLNGCVQQEDNLVYGPDNPDPWSANNKVAQLDSLSPASEYPTNIVTISGSGFDTRSVENNYTNFGGTMATVVDVWADSLHVEVPMHMPLDFFYSDTVDVRIALQGSFNWSNTVPFLYMPMAHQYVVYTYPEQHPEEKFTKPRGITFDAEGNAYVINARLRSIYKDTPAGGERIVYAFRGVFDGGLRFSPDGYLYAAGNTNNTIYRIPPGGDSFETWASIPSPWGLDFDAAGNLYVVDNNSGDIYRISPENEIKKIADFLSSDGVGFCKINNEQVYVNAGSIGNIYRFSVTADTVNSIDTLVVESANLINDITFDQNGIMYISAGTSSVNTIIVIYETGIEEELVEIDSELTFLSISDKFLYVSLLDAPVYKILIPPQN